MLFIRELRRRKTPRFMRQRKIEREREGRERKSEMGERARETDRDREATVNRLNGDRDRAEQKIEVHVT